MGVISKIQSWFKNEPVQGADIPTPSREESNEIWIRLSVSRKGDNVAIEMYGLEKVNVCLASFLTKGVSYAQEKYNEYKQSPKDAMDYAVRDYAIAGARQVKEQAARKGGKRCSSM